MIILLGAIQNIKSFAVILLQWVGFISLWMCECGSKSKYACVGFSLLLVDVRFCCDTISSPLVPAQAHDGNDRIPRLLAQTWAHWSRIWGESWTSCSSEPRSHYYYVQVPTHQSFFQESRGLIIRLKHAAFESDRGKKKHCNLHFDETFYTKKSTVFTKFVYPSSKCNEN